MRIVPTYRSTFDIFKWLSWISEQPHSKTLPIFPFSGHKKTPFGASSGALPVTYFVVLAFALAAGFAGFAAGALSFRFGASSSGASSSVVT